LERQTGEDFSSNGPPECRVKFDPGQCRRLWKYETSVQLADGFILELRTGAYSTGLSILWKQNSRKEAISIPFLFSEAQPYNAFVPSPPPPGPPIYDLLQKDN
jgi:hypothetical protein